mmetsp:Transcript_20170/g.62368  ORF Transcript_20170/g.62368 Transcript_20170/m.62368 type:complete len:772 (+) Transcript_20170:64-2379(+)
MCESLSAVELLGGLGVVSRQGSKAARECFGARFLAWERLRRRLTEPLPEVCCKELGIAPMTIGDVLIGTTVPFCVAASFCAAMEGPLRKGPVSAARGAVFREACLRLRTTNEMKDCAAGILEMLQMSVMRRAQPARRPPPAISLLDPPRARALALAVDPRHGNLTVDDRRRVCEPRRRRRVVLLGSNVLRRNRRAAAGDRGKRRPPPRRRRLSAAKKEVLGKVPHARRARSGVLGSGAQSARRRRTCRGRFQERRRGARREGALRGSAAPVSSYDVVEAARLDLVRESGPRRLEDRRVPRRRRVRTPGARPGRDERQGQAPSGHGTAGNRLHLRRRPRRRRRRPAVERHVARLRRPPRAVASDAAKAGHLGGRHANLRSTRQLTTVVTPEKRGPPDHRPVCLRRLQPRTRRPSQGKRGSRRRRALWQRLSAGPVLSRPRSPRGRPRDRALPPASPRRPDLRRRPPRRRPARCLARTRETPRPHSARRQPPLGLPPLRLLGLRPRLRERRGRRTPRRDRSVRPARILPLRRRPDLEDHLRPLLGQLAHADLPHAQARHHRQHERNPDHDPPPRRPRHLHTPPRPPGRREITMAPRSSGRRRRRSGRRRRKKRRGGSRRTSAGRGRESRRRESRRSCVSARRRGAAASRRGDTARGCGRGGSERRARRRRRCLRRRRRPLRGARGRRGSRAARRSGGRPGTSSRARRGCRTTCGGSRGGRCGRSSRWPRPPRRRTKRAVRGRWSRGRPGRRRAGLRRRGGVSTRRLFEGRRRL